jgi:molybdenum cofactor synthesis domain-containing protein
VTRVAILVVSSKIAGGQEEDQGKAALAQLVESIPASLIAYEVAPDERPAIRERLVSLCDGGTADVVLTVGGTGVRPTDVVPEVTREVVEKEIPGIGEAMRQESLKKVQTAMLSRGTAGIRGRTLIVNLPGSPRGARENLNVVLPVLEHTIEKIQGR